MIFNFFLISFLILDPVYAAKCLQHARDLFDFAQTYQGSYSDHIETGEKYQVSFSKQSDLTVITLVGLESDPPCKFRRLIPIIHNIIGKRGAFSNA